jgi:hypothetical protein
MTGIEFILTGFILGFCLVILVMMCIIAHELWQVHRIGGASA